MNPSDFTCSLYTWDYTCSLYTWDYTRLRNGLPSKNVDPALINLGFVCKIETDNPRAHSYGEPKKITIHHITPKGQAWVAAVEKFWEDQCQGARWWAISGTPGSFVIAIPDGIHPSETVRDLRRYFGSPFRLADPANENQCEGNPKLLGATWRPWNEWRPFLDMMDEEPESHVMRGAFMRLHGAPLDPGLSFFESAGEAPPQNCSTIDVNMAYKIARLPDKLLLGL